MTQPVDLEHLEMFTDGDKETEAELFDLFIEQADISINELESARLSNDNDSWATAAHRIKGSAANLGANDLQKVCQIAEEKFEQSQENKEKMLNDIKSQLNIVKGFLEERRNA